MRRDLKKGDTYRFNGNPHLHTGSIRPVTIQELETRIREVEAKLANPTDADDKKWTERWLRRYQAELAKKVEGLSVKTEEKSKTKSVRRASHEHEAPNT